MMYEGCRYSENEGDDKGSEHAISREILSVMPGEELNGLRKKYRKKQTLSNVKYGN